MEVSLLHLIGFSHLRWQNKHEGIKWKVNYPRLPSLLEGTGEKQSNERACQPRLPLRMNRLVPKTGGESTNLACFSKHLQKSGKWSEQANDLKKRSCPDSQNCVESKSPSGGAQRCQAAKGQTQGLKNSRGSWCIVE